MRYSARSDLLELPEITGVVSRVGSDELRAAIEDALAEALEEALAGAVPCERVESLEHAVTRAAEVAKPGDVVLLAPACASFDQFTSFEARGDAFRELVEGLA